MPRKVGIPLFNSLLFSKRSMTELFDLAEGRRVMIKNLLASLALGLISCAISRFSLEFSGMRSRRKNEN